MAKNLYFKKFKENYDLDNYYSNGFVFVTKMQDFGNTYSKKSIQSMILSFTDSKATGVVVGHISYRFEQENNFSLYGSIYVPAASTVKVRYKINVPIDNFYQIQFKIMLATSKSDVAINDISIVYREYREITSSNLSEG